MSAQVEDKEIDLSNLIRNYLKAAKRFWWILIACTVLFAGLLPLVMSLRHTPEYEATCSFTVRVVNNSVTEELNSQYDLYYDKLGLKATVHANYRMAIQRPSFEIYGDKGAYIKCEKDQQERDLKHFYLPAGHDDFGLDTPEQWGTLRYYDEDGNIRLIEDLSGFAYPKLSKSTFVIHARRVYEHHRT